MEIGAQLYNVREFTQTEEGFNETFRKIAQMGFKSVQVCSMGPFTADTIRKAVDKHGLSIVLTHYDSIRVRDDTDAVIAEHKIMGADYIGISIMPDEYRSDRAGILRFIKDYEKPACKIAEAGLKFMYHNHSFEFNRFDGRLVFDDLAEGFSPEAVGFTADLYWIAYAGADPAQWLDKLAGRIDTIHYKDMKIEGKKQMITEIMEGNLNWPRIFEASLRGGVKYAFIEQDDCYGADPFDCLEKSYRNLKKANLA